MVQMSCLVRPSYATCASQDMLVLVFDHSDQLVTRRAKVPAWIKLTWVLCKDLPDYCGHGKPAIAVDVDLTHSGSGSTPQLFLRYADSGLHLAAKSVDHRNILVELKKGSAVIEITDKIKLEKPPASIEIASSITLKNAATSAELSQSAINLKNGAASVAMSPASVNINNGALEVT